MGGGYDDDDHASLPHIFVEETEDDRIAQLEAEVAELKATIQNMEYEHKEQLERESYD